MNKDLNTEYRDMISDDLPDLWDRISAALPEKQPETAARFRLQSSAPEKPARKNRTRIYQIAMLAAAACVCAAIAIPIALMSGARNNAASSAIAAAPSAEREAKNAAAEAEEMADADAGEYYEYEYESTEMTAEEAKSTAPAEAAEEAAIQDTAAAEEIEISDEAAAAAVPQTESVPEDAAPQAPVYRQVSVEIIAVYPQDDGSIRYLARIQQPCEEADLMRDDRITLIADGRTDPELFDSLAPHCLYGLDLEPVPDEDGTLLYHITG